jgi:hypothetical protein
MTYAVIVDFIAMMLGITMGCLLYREEGAPVAEPLHA